MSGTRISSTFDGRCVKTIVLISPKRAASGPAASAETPARMLAPKKIAPSTAGSTPKRSLNQKATKLWIDEPAGERIEREQGRQAGITTRLGLVEPEARADRAWSTTSRGGTSTAGETRRTGPRGRTPTSA